MAQLLAYYTLSLAPDPALARQKRREALQWFIKNQPDAEILGTPFSQVNMQGDRLADPVAYRQLASDWKATVSAHPDNQSALDHAVAFLAVNDPNDALQLIQSAKAWVHRLRWAGRIYALRSQGAVAVDPTSGDVTFKHEAVDSSSQAILRHSDSVEMVLAAAWTLAETGAPESAFCSDLLAHPRPCFLRPRPPVARLDTECPK